MRPPLVPYSRAGLLWPSSQTLCAGPGESDCLVESPCCLLVKFPVVWWHSLLFVGDFFDLMFDMLESCSVLESAECWPKAMVSVKSNRIPIFEITGEIESMIKSPSDTSNWIAIKWNYVNPIQSPSILLGNDHVLVLYQFSMENCPFSPTIYLFKRLIFQSKLSDFHMINLSNYRFRACFICMLINIYIYIIYIHRIYIHIP